MSDRSFLLVLGRLPGAADPPDASPREPRGAGSYGVHSLSESTWQQFVTDRPPEYEVSTERIDAFYAQDRRLVDASPQMRLVEPSRYL